jgi:hypothetical protein
MPQIEPEESEADSVQLYLPPHADRFASLGNTADKNTKHSEKTKLSPYPNFLSYSIFQSYKHFHELSLQLTI